MSLQCCAPFYVAGLDDLTDSIKWECLCDHIPGIQGKHLLPYLALELDGYIRCFVRDIESPDRYDVLSVAWQIISAGKGLIEFAWITVENIDSLAAKLSSDEFLALKQNCRQ